MDRRVARWMAALGIVGLSNLGPGVAIGTAGDRPNCRRARVVTETATTSRPADRVAPSPMLGSFRATSYVNIRDSGVVVGASSPIGLYGRENSFEVFGPLSSFRATSAPVNTVVRGYDGVPTVVQGTSFSNPNRPELSPVVYPTRASNYSSLRTPGPLPSRASGRMWVDLN